MSRHATGQGSGAVTVPVRWPSAWPHLWPAARDRAVFVLAVSVLTVGGIVATGDLAAQWWVPLLPLVLLAGPVSRPPRVRRAVQRAAAGGRLVTMPGRLLPADGSAVHLVPAGGAPGTAPVALPPGRVRRILGAGAAGGAAVLVWVPRRWASRAPCALVLCGSGDTDSPDAGGGVDTGTTVVGYLDRLPRGVRRVAGRAVAVSAAPAVLLTGQSTRKSSLRH